MNGVSLFCRFCAKEKQLDEVINLQINKRTLEDVLTEISYFPVDFSDLTNISVLPKYICIICRSSLYKAHQFLDTMKKSKDVLANFLCHVKIKEEVMDSNDARENENFDIDVTVARNNFNSFNQSSTTTWLNYPWVCGVCSINFGSLPMLREHCIETHNMCFAAKCVDCTLDIFNFNAFRTHVVGHRKELKLYCKYCNFKAANETDARIHSDKHNEVENLCFKCGKLLINESHASDYCVDIGNITWKQCNWICGICTNVFQTIAILRRHCVKQHGICFSALCTDCGLKIDKYSPYVQHLRDHINVLSYYCSICNIPLEKDENEHFQEAHKKKSQVGCSTCGQIFGSKYYRKRHYSRIKKTPHTREKKQIVPKKEIQQLTCKDCKKVFKTKKKYKEHLQTHKQHKKVDRKRNCAQCGRACQGKSAYEKHVMIDHGGSLSFPCEVCEKVFTSPLKLRKHLRTHNPDRAFICDICSKAFKIKTTLKGHLAIHFNEKTHECDICHKQFRFAKNLKIHSNVHTGVKPYSCSECPMKFGNWGNCNKHMKRRHALTIAKTFLTPMGRMPLKSNVLTEDLSESHYDEDA